MLKGGGGCDDLDGGYECQMTLMAENMDESKNGVDKPESDVI